MHWRHKTALEHFTASDKVGRVIQYSCSPGIGEATFKTAIREGWLEEININSGSRARKWWQADYKLTAKGKAALADALFAETSPTLRDEAKPHKGRIENWSRFLTIPEHSLGFLIEGRFLDHPDFAGQKGHTSLVVSQDGNEIETRNSRYTLVGPEIVRDDC